MPWTKEDLEIIRADEAGELKPPPQSLIDKMQAQAEANHFLRSPQGAEAHEFLSLSQEEYERRYPDRAFANAYDEEDAERESNPEDDPARLEDRTMETYQAMAERDAEAWNRRHSRK